MKGNTEFEHCKRCCRNTKSLRDWFVGFVIAQIVLFCLVFFAALVGVV